jgi:hypothetical protein
MKRVYKPKTKLTAESAEIKTQRNTESKKLLCALCECFFSAPSVVETKVVEN